LLEWTAAATMRRAVSAESLRTEHFQRAVELLERVPAAEREKATRVVGDVLLAQAEERVASVSPALVDMRCAMHGANAETARIESIAPIEALRRGANGVEERAVLSVLLARHMAGLAARVDGAGVLRRTLPGLDWMEFTGPYAPYAAARSALAPDDRAPLDAVLTETAVTAPSPSAECAVRVLRGVLPAPEAASSRAPAAAISVACNVEGLQRSVLGRWVAIMTGYALVRGLAHAVGRMVFSWRRPATITLEGDALRLVGHSELAGRTLQTFDVRFPLAQIAEIHREARYPHLPAAISIVALGTGFTLGARAVIEGAGAVYFPLVGLGLGLIVGGFVFDLLLRALLPGLRGRVRLRVRSVGAKAMVLGDLPIGELDRLLDALDARSGVSPAATRRPGSRSGAGVPARRPASEAAASRAS